jgi:hypothetical protein
MELANFGGSSHNAVDLDVLCASDRLLLLLLPGHRPLPVSDPCAR